MTETPEIRPLPTGQIAPGDNDRTHFDPVALAELADSIAEHGLAQPITVRPIWTCADCGAEIPATFPDACPCGYDGPWSQMHYQIVAGERRFRAVSTLLDWPTIPAIVRNLNDEQADAIMLAENVHRVDLNPLDEAKAYRKRMDRHGWSVAQVADAAHVTTRRVGNRLKLLDLVPEAQDLIACGQMGVKWGEVMSQLEPHYQREAMQYLVSTERPLLREFEALCGELLVKQAQLAMFSADDLWIEQVLDDHNAAREERYEQVFPSDERLPVMRKVKTIGLSFETYIAQLLASDDPFQRRAAAIVGRVYEGMLAGGMAFPPREGSPLRS